MSLRPQALLSALAAVCLSLSLAAAAAPSKPLPARAAELFQRVVAVRDHQERPFIIIDKRRAHMWVFDAAGRRLGDAPVLLGSARGDHTAPGVGDLQLAQIRPEDRTTPAGRFVTQVGKDLRGDDVVWVDYESGVSIHRVLTGNARERRAQRLASPTPDDNRITFGCINVSRSFFDKVVFPAASRSKAVVYILPESVSLQSVFGALVPPTG